MLNTTGLIRYSSLIFLKGSTSVRVELSLHCFLSFIQTLKKLRQVETINFGDCLVRSKGAVAIAEAVSEGLHKLKVFAIVESLFLHIAMYATRQTKYVYR